MNKFQHVSNTISVKIDTSVIVGKFIFILQIL